jgi:hypothetical protein
VAVIDPTPGIVVKRWLAALPNAIPSAAAPMRARETVRAAIWVARAQRTDLGASGRSPAKNCRWSSGEPEFMEDAAHCALDGLIVGVDRFGVV